MITTNRNTGAVKIIITGFDPEFLAPLRSSIRTSIARIAEAPDYDPRKDGSAIFYLTTLLEQMEPSREKEIEWYKTQLEPTMEVIPDTENKTAVA
ncbi:hypothetical protein [Rufibacter soli]